MCGNVSRGFLQGFDLKSLLFNIFVREERKKKKSLQQFMNDAEVFIIVSNGQGLSPMKSHLVTLVTS